MEMSVGALDHYNVSTRNSKRPCSSTRRCLGFVKRPASAVQISLGPGCIVRAMPFAPQGHFPDRQAAAPGFRRHRSHRV